MPLALWDPVRYVRGVGVVSAFDNLILRSRLGEGLLVEAWLAVDQVSDGRRPCVVERLRPEFVVRPGIEEAFVESSLRARALRHPRVVCVLGAGTIHGRIQRVVEHHAGLRVAQLLAKLGTGIKAPSAALVLSLLDQVLTILAAAHAAGFVHGALLPEAVRIGSRGRVILADFLVVAQVAKALSEEARPVFGQRIAPEVVTGEVDARADVFSVGALGAALLAHFMEDFPGWKEMASLCARACAPIPAARFPDADSMQSELRELAEREDISLSEASLDSYVQEVIADLNGIAGPRATIPEHPIFGHPTDPAPTPLPLVESTDQEGIDEPAGFMSLGFGAIESLNATTTKGLVLGFTDAGPTAVRQAVSLPRKASAFERDQVPTRVDDGTEEIPIDVTIVELDSDPGKGAEGQDVAASALATSGAGYSEPPIDFSDDGPTIDPRFRRMEWVRSLPARKGKTLDSWDEGLEHTGPMVISSQRRPRLPSSGEFESEVDLHPEFRLGPPGALERVMPTTRLPRPRSASSVSSIHVGPPLWLLWFLLAAVTLLAAAVALVVFDQV